MLNFSTISNLNLCRSHQSLLEETIEDILLHAKYIPRKFSYNVDKDEAKDEAKDVEDLKQHGWSGKQILDLMNDLREQQADQTMTSNSRFSRPSPNETNSLFSVGNIL